MRSDGTRQDIWARNEVMMLTLAFLLRWIASGRFVLVSIWSKMDGVGEQGGSFFFFSTIEVEQYTWKLTSHFYSSACVCRALSSSRSNPFGAFALLGVFVFVFVSVSASASAPTSVDGR